MYACSAQMASTPQARRMRAVTCVYRCRDWIYIYIYIYMYVKTNVVRYMIYTSTCL